MPSLPNDTYNSTYSNYDSSQPTRREKTQIGIYSFFGFVVMFLLVISIIRMVQGQQFIPTFTSFLELLSEVPDLSIPFINFSQTNLGDWGVFNLIRDGISIFLSLFDVIIFLINGIVNLLVYVVYFCRWAFLA